MASMDLESLLADLDMAASKSAPKSAPAPPPAAPVAASATAAAAAGGAPGVSFDDLDSLMDDLAHATSKPQAAVEETASPAPASKPVVVAKATTPAAAPVPAPTPAAQQQPKPAAAVIDDLDALVESLDATAKEATAAQSQQQQQKPRAAQQPVAQAVPEPEPAPATTTPAQPIDALDDLLGELSMAAPPTSSSYSSSSQQQQQQQPRPATTTTTTTAAVAAAPPVSRQPRDELDGLLANLSSEMSRVDADTTVSRGICGRCGRPITGEVIQAMRKMWHPEHFTCAACKQPLGTSTFYESEGQPYCDRCWKSLFCPRCAHCDQPIADRCITALGKKWHPEHFICSQCLQPLDQGFYERDGKAFCEHCFYGAYSAKCAGCGEPIRGECINALGQKWHPEHFVCATCKKSFGSGAFFEYQGQPYCEIHYYQMTGSLCAGCGKSVGTRSITALGKKWHPEHFVCAFCTNPLGGGSFKEQAGKAYCSACFAKLFG